MQVLTIDEIPREKIKQGSILLSWNLEYDGSIFPLCREENIASLRALDSCLKEKLSTWLSPAALELHQITWDDPASLLEKIVAYEVLLSFSSLEFSYCAALLFRCMHNIHYLV